MIDRWVPVVASILGLAGGLGGAYVGGRVANDGQQQQFEHERATRMQDSRQQTYVTYLMELERHFFLGGTPEKARAAEAAVLLVSSPAIREAATKAGDAANGDDLTSYSAARDAFIELAQRELTAGG